MKASNIQDRKLNIIEKLILHNDEDVFKQIEKLINSSMKRLTKEELIKRAKISNRNIEKEEVLTQEEVEKLSQRW